MGGVDVIVIPPDNGSRRLPDITIAPEAIVLATAVGAWLAYGMSPGVGTQRKQCYYQNY
jgi:hypothetical protein